MEDSANLAVIVGIYVTLIGTAWGALIDPLRPATYWISVILVVITGFLIAGLAPDATMSVPLLTMSFATTAWYRERRRRASLSRQQRPPRTPPPPPPSASANG